MEFDLNSILNTPPYSLSKWEREELQGKVLNKLTQHHYKNCPQYRKILDILGLEPSKKFEGNDFPFIPVRLFKEHELLSIKKNNIFKTLTSSGTSGKGTSKIFLDQATAIGQKKALVKIVSDFIGPRRLPMLVIDKKSVLRDRNLFSARGAGILGFSVLGRDVTYVLDDEMRMDFDLVEEFCNKHRNGGILIFGFTFMVWEFFYKSLIRSNRKITLDNGILIHGGGWKKMNEEAVVNETFKRNLKEACGISKVLNYYGMVEQTGSIFMECEEGFLHTSVFSDIITRDIDFLPCAKNEIGLIQLLSILPSSYPGHSILSEDIGEILGEDDCACGRRGKYFMVHGRALKAETRGCSDAYA